MTSTMHQIPSSASLHQLALDTLARCGVDVDALGGDVVNTSPVNGQRLVDIGWVDASSVDDTVARAREAFLAWRTVPLFAAIRQCTAGYSTISLPALSGIPTREARRMCAEFLRGSTAGSHHRDP